jgi:hypothetical protein
MQLDAFRMLIPPCGRSSAAYCEIEMRSSATNVWTCPRCLCVVPIVTRSS